MKRAIELSVESVNNGGGPFGSVIVKDDKIIPIIDAPATPEKIFMSVNNVKAKL